jgi:hypothetical protein
VPLFNGKSLTGWKKYPDRKGEWTVEKGVLVGRGPVGLLFSERGDYRNFELHVEAASNDRGFGGVFIRTPAFALIAHNNDPEGHKAVINSGNANPIRTGSLWRLFQGDIGFNFGKFDRPLPRPGEWFALDVTARGPDIAIALNGEQTLSYHDAKHGDARGFLVLQVLQPGGEIRFRKIEIKELPAGPG